MKKLDLALQMSAICTGLEKSKALESKIILERITKPTRDNLIQAVSGLFEKDEGYRQRYIKWHQAFIDLLQKDSTEREESFKKFEETVLDLWDFPIVNAEQMKADFDALGISIMCIGNHFGWSPDVLPPKYSDEKLKEHLLIPEIANKYASPKLYKNIGQEKEAFNPHSIYHIGLNASMKKAGVNNSKFVLRGKGDAYNEFYTATNQVVLPSSGGTKALAEALDQNDSNIFIFSEWGFRMMKDFSSWAVVASLMAGKTDIALFAAPDPFISPEVEQIPVYYLGLSKIPQEVIAEYQQWQNGEHMKNYTKSLQNRIIQGIKTYTTEGNKYGEIVGLKTE